MWQLMLPEDEHDPGNEGGFSLGRRGCSSRDMRGFGLVRVQSERL